MKIVLASTILSGFVAVALAQQRQSPFIQPPTAPAPAQNNAAAQNTTSANQGVTTNPTGDAGTATSPTSGVNSGVLGQPITNSTGGSAFNTPAGGTNQGGANIGTAPLFVNVSPTTITDANGQPLGTLQQLVLSPNGAVTFGLVNVGGRLTPVPWQLIVTGNGTARGSLAVNTDRSILQSAPPISMGQVPMLTQDQVALQILNHFGLQSPVANAQPTVANTTTARGGTGGGAGVTITGGSTNAANFGTNTFSSGAATNNGSIPNNTMTNQAVNTTGGLLSPTGRTNGIRDSFNSGPGSTDRFGPRQSGNAPQPTPAPGTGRR